MKILGVTLIICTCVLINFNSQAQSYNKNENILGFTAGLGNGYVDNAYGYALGLSAEHFFFKPFFRSNFSIGIGTYIGYAQTEQKAYTYTRKNYNYIATERIIKYKTSAVALRAALHFTGLRKFDFYYGLQLGAAFISSDNEYPPSIWGNFKIDALEGVLFSAVIGARYYVGDSFSLNCEFLGGLGIVGVGVGHRFSFRKKKR